MQLLNVLVERNIGSLGSVLKYLNPFPVKLKKGCRVFASLNGSKIVGIVDSIIDENFDPKFSKEKFGYSIKLIENIIDEEPFLNEELLRTVDEVSSYYLLDKLSLFSSILPKPFVSKTSFKNGPKIAYEKVVKIKRDLKDEKLTLKQKEVFDLIKLKKEVLVREISDSILDKLVKLDLVSIYEKEKKRYEAKPIQIIEKNILNDNQKECVEGIYKCKDKIALLQGITGSGKTEVYMELIKRTLKENKTVLFLVPEISLTPYIISYFYSRFEDKLAVIHSGLTPSQFYDEYRKILAGEVSVVLGVRKAVFAPLENIGLIIIDEEHDEAYKQKEHPFYDARFVATLRRKYYDALLVLGSATPSIETKTQAELNKISFFKLKERINKISYIPTTIVDMKNPLNYYKDSIIFSSILIDKIKEKLNKKEQIILLVEKKGYSYLMCPKCGLTFKCDKCGSTLTYYKKNNTLKCHKCDSKYSVPKVCPNCNHDHFYEVGFGVEKVEEEISKLFPKSKVLRLDRDVLEEKGKVDEIIKDFSNQKGDILIGTSMVSKGLDFKKVTLVGLVLVDIGLNVPLFKSNENTFSLIFQSIGRSGRDELRGEAVIQTFYKDHFVIKTASKQDYETFYNLELKERKLSFNPPYCTIFKVSVMGTYDRKLLYAINTIKGDLLNKNLENTILLGPSLDILKSTNSFKSYSLLIKSKKVIDVKNYLKEAQTALLKNSNIRLYISVNSED